MKQINDFHPTVFLNEAVDLLQVKTGKIYLDATLGGGGHASEIIRRGGFVFGIDWDQDAIDHCEKKLTKLCKELNRKREDSFVLNKTNFTNMSKHYQLDQKPSGIIFDLGTSRHQLLDKNRGFSFREEGPLDMRMDQDLSIKASDLLNTLNFGDLHYLLDKFGNEPKAKKIAARILTDRKKEPFTNTRQLASLVAQFYPRRGRIDPATRTFQALRVAVNFELDNLAQGLQEAYKILPKQGRLVFISFQPMEDKLVYEFFKPLIKNKKVKKLCRALKVNQVERKNNPSARSAMMRAYLKNI